LSGRVVAGIAVSVLLPGCWLQVGFAADNARHNVLETGITRGNVTGLHEAWSVDFPNGVSEPIASGGRVYMARSSQTSAEVRALDAATGAEVWQRVVVPPQLPDPSVPFLVFPVAFSGDALWISYATSSTGIHFVSLDPAGGSILTDSPGGLLVTTPVATAGGVAAYAAFSFATRSSTLVVRDPHTAAVQWTVDLAASNAVENVAVARGHLYAPASSVLTAFAAAGCGAATCPPIWQAPMPNGALIRRVAVAPDGSVVVTANFFMANHVFDMIAVFDGATGTLRWTRTVNDIAGDAVAIAGSSVFVPTNEAPDGSGGTAGEDALVAMSLADGTTQWDAGLPASSAVPLVAAGVVYTAAGDDLVAFDAAGCGAATCDPLLTLAGAGRPRSIGEGQLYTTVFAPGTLTSTLRAFRIG
jgi:outer membrane protein assembly factor BamB